MGKLIVIEGLDGSGKATQTALLAKTLANQDMAIREVSFPDYNSPSSALVKMYLAGEFGPSPSDVNAYAASSFYAVDRYASYAKDWGAFYNEGGLILADRYTTSNAVHQCCKLPENQRADFVNWLEDFEYQKLGIPKPDFVIYLDVEPQVSRALLYDRNGGRDDEDIHEADLAYQQHCREAALWCARRLGWKQLACSSNGQMRPAAEIAKDIANLTKENI